jgi:hypothetical protein
MIGKAQIVLQKSSIVTTSASFRMYDDTSTLVSFDYDAGENTTWEFNNLNEHDTTVLTFRNADWYPSRVSSAIPGATYVFEDEGDYTYLKLTDSALIFMGSAQDTGVGPLEVEEFGFDFIRFPMTYGDTVKGEDILVFQQEDSLGIVPGPGAPRIDSIRAQGFMSSTFIGVGTGSLEINNNTFEKAIQVWNQVIMYPKVYAKIGNNWIEIDENYANQLNIPYTKDTTNRMMWWNTLYGTGVPLIQFELENSGDTVRGIEYTSESVQMSSINSLNGLEIEAYPNPTQNQIKIKGVTITDNTILLTGINGQDAKSLNLLSNQVLDLNAIKPGVYLIYLQTTEGLVKCRIQKL